MEKDEKALALEMLGSMFGEMKAIDDSLVGSSKSLERRSDTIKQELTKVVASIVPPQPPQIESRPSPAISASPASSATPSDPLQLEFDLNKVARYEDIMEALKETNRKLDILIRLFDEEISRKPKKKLTGS